MSEENSPTPIAGPKPSKTNFITPEELLPELSPQKVITEFVTLANGSISTNFIIPNLPSATPGLPGPGDESRGSADPLEPASSKATPTGSAAGQNTAKNPPMEDPMVSQATESQAKSQNKTGAIAGGVIGAVIGLILVAVVVFIVLRMKKRKKNRAAKELLPYSSVSGSPIVDENKYPSVSEAPIKSAAAPIGITTSQHTSTRGFDSPLPAPPMEAYPQSINTSSYSNSPTLDQSSGFYDSQLNPATIGQAITTDSPHLLQHTSPTDTYHPQYLNTDYNTTPGLAVAGATSLQRADTTVSGRTDISRDLDRSVSQNTAGPNIVGDPPSPVLSITLPPGEPSHIRLDDNRSPSPVYGDEERRGLFQGRDGRGDLQEVPRLPIYDRVERGSAL
ncbi:hypothetical protein BJ508DRAFT_335533 [Ascobolus immersus RN42]|uniref:receptor protein-tyrosine kinase n=1 Tax=Ascobolus immersus RN42 TaxID=1160509 RepID=A0A3N4HQI3_ASCIM|nr:hypothetical protein BJ508DRAFT_335533 [Ascobolus immersus RN42]